MAIDSNCIFCKIASGDIPAAIVWSSDTAVAFLDVNPLAEGHILLIPRAHCSDFRDCPAQQLADLIAPLPTLVDALMTATGATGVNVLQNTGASAGQAVFHLHMHLIPRIDSDSLGYRWNAGTYTPGRADEMLAALKAALG
ncbi:MAG TPA: HIT family protein [Phycisphaerae bacterium]|nr:HIT family protein [Phycisphaerae bacterium]HRW53262.1 HIT family protein [Phycisphaerae bacterium]